MVKFSFVIQSLMVFTAFTSARAFIPNAALTIARSSPKSVINHNAWRRQFAMVSSEARGATSTEEYRIFFKDDSGKEISPWHDIPLSNGDGTYNFLNEIPKYTKAKMEVSTKEAKNPIAQDIKKGKLRDYHGPIFWNYGMLPQTWEDPNHEHPELKVMGDNDPVDVVEIGSAILEPGSVTAVKPLGVLAMIDDGELDWKILAINKHDPMAEKLNDVNDIETHMPGVISGVREWFRWYKTPDDKPLNAFGFDEKCLDKATAIKVIEETNGFWKALTSGKSEKGKLWTNEKQLENH